ncbi:T9SS type A sorting domain-containing protein [Flavobacterium sp. J27]|uniref:T9SS type A sorting domain-containing protein n=1 Tax=Flavobacterium sp. J27 TaxID=2060419 RepID=UPI001030C9A7|nr:T9SS type A sorting domain-containing protein [Flavobacterium sp. J27]
MRTRLFLIIAITLFSFTNLSAQDCDGFTTFTIGGWGSKCHGQNPGCYRDTLFDLAFPNGLTIGCGDNVLLLTSSEAVQDFLPSGSTPRALEEGTMIDPGRTYRNVLAAQLVGVTLAVGFDEYDEDFGFNYQYFANLIIAEGSFEGMSVYDFLELANSAIGGCITGYSFSELNAAATAINENYDGGNSNNGYLLCPDDIYTEKSVAVSVYPNPMVHDATLDLSFNYDTSVTVTMYNLNGQLVNEVYAGNLKSNQKESVAIHTNTLKPGVYFVTIKTDKNIVNRTITVAN